MIVSAPESAHTAGAPAAAAAEAARAVGPGLEAVREHAPLVQAVTNTVVAGFTANVLLALGAAPAMVDIPGEAAPFAAAADGLLINLGTPHRESAEAMLDAARAASAVGTPWVLDPVAIGVLPVRTRLAAELLALHPSVIRGNASEIIALAGRGSGGRGVDATDDAESALEAALELAGGHGAASGRTVVAVSGPVDLITDGERVVRAANGSPLLTRVTGGGCALGAVMAAFAGAAQAATAPHLFGAVVSAVTAYNVAAEHAAAVAAGPGSFAVAFLDALAALTPDAAAREGRLS